jgi:chromate transporter
MTVQERDGAQTEAPPARHRWSDAWEVFVVALGLGLTSFGGPVAHLGYFERAYVQRRRWLTAQAYAGIVALCQTLPGPTSSQVGFLVGLARAGWRGALAAWAGFTAPSALLMVAFALAAPRLGGPVAATALHGLKLVAAPIVAQAVWSMARRLTPDLARALMAVVAAGVVLLAGWGGVQIAVLAAGALAGAALCRDEKADGPAPVVLPIGPRAGAGALAAFLLLLLLAALALAGGRPGSPLALAAVFYRSGALVFGGGHVVLPLLRSALVPRDWLTDGTFLSGYGAAQALPGPLFTFAAFLGATVAPAGAGWAVKAAWAFLALVAIFLPGLLLALAGAPLWSRVSRHPAARGALAGINAAVVGLLAAALVTPIWTSAVTGPADVAIAVAGLLLLLVARAPPLAVVVLTVAGAIGAAALEGRL